MISWFSENIGTIIVALTVSAAAAMIIIRAVKNRKSGKSSCGCGCSCCPMEGKCGADRLTRVESVKH